MSYKIAIASSNQVNVDLNFGAASEFLIYEVEENDGYHLLEIRKISTQNKEKDTSKTWGCQSSCASGCGQTSGCGDAQADNPKVLILSDCRCIICKKVGFHIQKQLEKKAIITFDIEGEIEEVLHKITTYFNRVDHHQTLRGIANKMGEET